MIDIRYYLGLIKMPSLKSCLLAFSIALVQLSHTIFGLTQFSLLDVLSALVYCSIFPFVWDHTTNKVVTLTSKHNRIALDLSFLFACFITLGYSIEVKHDFSLCYMNIVAALISTIKFALLIIALHPLVLYATAYFDRPLQQSQAQLNLKKVFFLLAGVRLLLWIACFPGFFDFDAAFGLRTILNEGEVQCNHHPLFVQLIHGAFFNLGKMLGNPAVGMGILSLLSVVVSSAIIIYCINLLQKFGLGKKWLYSIICIYAFHPLFPIVSLYITKDGFFAYAFLLYFATIFDLLLTSGNALKKIDFVVLHIMSIVFVCLTRHQGFYIIVLESLILLLYYRKRWYSVLYSTLPAIIVVVLFNNVLLPRLDVEPSNKKEMYGMLFQQTAYYLTQHPDDVTESETSAIRGVMDPDLIVKKYQYNLVDDVKSCYVYTEKGEDQPDGMLHFRQVDHTGEKEALSAYQKAWLSMFLRHPVTYIEATCAVIGGFFYNVGTPIYYLDSNWDKSALATNSNFTFIHSDVFVIIYNRYLSRILALPLLSILFSLPYYIWFSLLILGVLVCRLDMRGVVLSLPIILSIGVLLLCPVATGRYEWPVIMCLPLLFVYAKQGNNLKNQ